MRNKIGVYQEGSLLTIFFLKKCYANFPIYIYIYPFSCVVGLKVCNIPLNKNLNNVVFILHSTFCMYQYSVSFFNNLANFNSNWHVDGLIYFQSWVHNVKIQFPYYMIDICPLDWFSILQLHKEEVWNNSLVEPQFLT